MGQSLVIDPLTNYLYIGFYNGEVIVLDGKQEIARFNLQDGYASAIRDLAVNNKTGDVYALYDNNRKLTRFNNAQLIDTLETGARDWSQSSMAVHPVTGDVYLTDYAAKKLIVVRNMTVIGRPKVGWTPNKMAIDPLTENVYVINTKHRTMSVINGIETIATLPIGYAAEDVAVDSTTGWVYVPNTNSHNLYIFGFD